MRLPKPVHRYLLRRAARVIARRDPDFIIGDNYLRRWYVVRDARRWVPGVSTTVIDGPHRGFNVYLHAIHRSDDDRALHTHPWASCSIILAGEYLEYLPVDPAQPAGETHARHRHAGDVVFRGAGSPHRLELSDDVRGGAITLFLTGPRVQEWGFACPKGWRHWRDFTAGTDGAQVGRGCGGLE